MSIIRQLNFAFELGHELAPVEKTRQVIGQGELPQPVIQLGQLLLLRAQFGVRCRQPLPGQGVQKRRGKVRRDQQSQVVVELGELVRMRGCDNEGPKGTISSLKRKQHE
jgi:hypothetical protein